MPSQEPWGALGTVSIYRHPQSGQLFKCALPASAICLRPRPLLSRAHTLFATMREMNVAFAGVGSFANCETVIVGTICGRDKALQTKHRDVKATKQQYARVMRRVAASCKLSAAISSHHPLLSNECGSATNPHEKADGVRKLSRSVFRVGDYVTIRTPQDSFRPPLHCDATVLLSSREGKRITLLILQHATDNMIVVDSAHATRAPRAFAASACAAELATSAAVASEVSTAECMRPYVHPADGRLLAGRCSSSQTALAMLYTQCSALLSRERIKRSYKFGSLTLTTPIGSLSRVRLAFLRTQGGGDLYAKQASRHSTDGNDRAFPLVHHEAIYDEDRADEANSPRPALDSKSIEDQSASKESHEDPVWSVEPAVRAVAALPTQLRTFLIYPQAISVPLRPVAPPSREEIADRFLTTYQRDFVAWTWQPPRRPFAPAPTPLWFGWMSLGLQTEFEDVQRWPWPKVLSWHEQRAPRTEPPAWELLPADVIFNDDALPKQRSVLEARQKRWGNANGAMPEERQRRVRRRLARRVMGAKRAAAGDWPRAAFFEHCVCAEPVAQGTIDDNCMVSMADTGGTARTTLLRSPLCLRELRARLNEVRHTVACEFELCAWWYCSPRVAGYAELKQLHIFGGSSHWPMAADPKQGRVHRISSRRRVAETRALTLDTPFGSASFSYDAELDVLTERLSDKAEVRGIRILGSACASDWYSV